MTEEIFVVVTLDALAVQLAGRTKGEAIPISLSLKNTRPVQDLYLTASESCKEQH